MIVFFSVWVCSFFLTCQTASTTAVYWQKMKRNAVMQNTLQSYNHFPVKSSIKNSFNWVRWAPEHLEPIQPLPPSLLQVWTPEQPPVGHLWAQLCRNFHSESPALIKEEHYYIPYNSFSTLSDFSETSFPSHSWESIPAPTVPGCGRTSSLNLKWNEATWQGKQGSGIPCPTNSSQHYQIQQKTHTHTHILFLEPSTTDLLCCPQKIAKDV